MKPFVLTVSRYGYIESMTAHADGTLTGTTVWCKKPVVTTHRFWSLHQLYKFTTSDEVTDLQTNGPKAYVGTWRMS